MRIIDADKLPRYNGYSYSALEIAHAVESAPTVDAVPVVRCKDCTNSGEHDSELPMVYCHAFERWVHEEFYCENGAKMEVSE